jgi:2-dehydropantoate 2-reductase
MDAIEPGRVFVVGAGGIGCAVGHALLSAGVPVVFVDADDDKVRHGREHGITVAGLPSRQAQFERFADWSAPRRAAVLLCTKCYDNAAVLDRLPDDAEILPIQNGFDDRLRERVEVEGIASFVSECEPHRAVTRITRGGDLHLGRCRAGDGATPVLDLLRCLAGRAPFRIRFVADVTPYKHTKLMYNAAISPLAAAAGIDNGKLLSVPRARRLFFSLLAENHAILRHAGLPLGTVGPFHPDTVHWILSHRLVAGALAWAFYPSLRGTYCSMSGDLPRGRTELENYNGYLIRLAGDSPCPLNRRVADLVRRMERERLPPAPERLAELEPPHAPTPACTANDSTLRYKGRCQG